MIQRYRQTEILTEMERYIQRYRQAYKARYIIDVQTYRDAETQRPTPPPYPEGTQGLPKADKRRPYYPTPTP